MTEKEYKQIMGLDTKDLGSWNLILKEVKKLAKEKGYKLSGFNHMPKYQLLAIHKKLSTARHLDSNL